MNLLLDTDIGTDVDDALALGLITGSPELTLVGISTVYGDTRLRAQLARRYLKIAGQDTSLPIAAGLQNTRSGKEVWWAGHEGRLFPDLAIENTGDDGVQLLVEAAAAHPGQVDVLAIGPLTNIAAALDADPEFESNVRQLVIMGGDFRTEGRISEHNFKSDVAAAQRVFTSSLEIVVGGLDLTLRIRLTPTEIDQVAAAGPFGSILADEVRVWWNFNDARGDLQWNSPHDPVLALWLADPSLFAARRAQVEITDDGVSLEQPAENGRVRILDAVDPDHIKDAIVDRLVAAARQDKAAAGSLS